MSVFIKWLGGKRKLADMIKGYIPADYSTYIEPFLGGGALFFSVLPEKAVLNDINSDLINLYKVVQAEPDEFFDIVDSYPVNKEFYYSIRDGESLDDSELSRAARIMYLNKTCFGGIYRVNKQGKFNVPWAGYENRKVVDYKTIVAASESLAGHVLSNKDYKEVLAEAKNKDLVYLDPPYLYEDGGFDRYNAKKFCFSDYEEIKEIMDELDGKGVYTILSTGFSDEVSNLFSEYDRVDIPVGRNIGSKSKVRLESIVISKTISEAIRGEYDFLRSY